MDDRTFVIVGASLAGGKAAETLRNEGFDGRLVLIGEDPERPYERPPLSKDLLLGKGAREQVFLHPEPWYPEHDIELRTGTRVTAIDPAAHQVVLADGERIGYQALLLATGARPRMLSLPGGDDALILRTLADAERLDAALREASRLVVIGAGWIGLEAAAAARQRGVEVVVVEQAALPLQQVLGDELATVFRDLHRGRGVDLRFGTSVREISTGHGGRITGVVLADGSTVPAEAVLVGIGVQPAVELAEAAGLAVDNGVLVDAAMRTSDPDIYAAGDVANRQHPVLGSRVRVEHWANALNGGPAAARAMLGQDAAFDDLPYFYTDQYDLGMEYAGHAPAGSYDRVVYRGTPAPDQPFIAFWLAGDRLLAGMNVNTWDVSDDIQALIRAGKPLDTARLADPDVPLAELL